MTRLPPNCRQDCGPLDLRNLNHPLARLDADLRAYSSKETVYVEH